MRLGLLVGRGAGPCAEPGTDSHRPRDRSAPAECRGGSTDSDQSPNGAAPARFPIGLSRHPGHEWVSACGRSYHAAHRIDGDSSVCLIDGRAAAAFIVEDRCTSCGVGHLQTIWGAGRPKWEEGPVVPMVLMDLHYLIDDCAFVADDALTRGRAPKIVGLCPSDAGTPSPMGLTRLSVPMIVGPRSHGSTKTAGLPRPSKEGIINGS